MDCPSCVVAIQGGLGELPGVQKVDVDVDTATARTWYAIQEGTEFQASLVSTPSAGGEGGTDYTPYIVLGIAGLFAAALAWPGISWGRRQLARAAAPFRAQRRRAGRSRRGR